MGHIINMNVGLFRMSLLMTPRALLWGVSPTVVGGQAWHSTSVDAKAPQPALNPLHMTSSRERPSRVSSSIPLGRPGCIGLVGGFTAQMPALALGIRRRLGPTPSTADNRTRTTGMGTSIGHRRLPPSVCQEVRDSRPDGDLLAERMCGRRDRA